MADDLPPPAWENMVAVGRIVLLCPRAARPGGVALSIPNLDDSWSLAGLGQLQGDVKRRIFRAAHTDPTCHETERS